MGPIKGIHVSEVLRKSDPVSAAKLTVLRCLRSYENEEASWAADQVLRALKSALPELEVADVYLPTYRFEGHASNDPDERRFDPADQFAAVLEPVEGADLLVVVATEACGLINSNVAKLVERLAHASSAKTREGQPPLLYRKAFAPVVIGGAHAQAALASLVAAFMALGSTPAGGAAWGAKGRAFKSDEFAATLDSLASDLASLARR